MSDPTFQAELEATIAALTAAGADYELVPADIDGTTMPVFRHAPRDLGSLYRAARDSYGDRDFYVFQEERYTYAEACALAGRVANALREAGVAPGDRVGIAMRNYPEWVLAFMGATSMGAVAVAMNAWWTSEELRYGIENSGLQVLFVDRERLERVTPFAAELGLRVVGVRCDTPVGAAAVGATTRSRSAEDQPREDRDRVVAPTEDEGKGDRDRVVAPTGTGEAFAAISWEQFIADSSAELPDVEVSPADNALILYTSGSTSHPKGVLSTHRAVIHALLGWEFAGAVAAELAPPPEDDLIPAMILTVPLFHVSGLNVQLLSSFRQGRKVVGMYKWDPEEALRLIEAERITHFNGVPTMSWELVQSPAYDKYDTSSLKAMGGGGAAMAPEHARQIDGRMKNGAAGTGYGMTETNGLATTIAGEALLTRPRSCGRPVPPIVEIRIVDAEGRPLAVGETGEIWIRGPMNFRGYWRDEAATRATLSEGWVHTGDVGHLDDENFLFITDRAKDMVIRGGENIGCQEVEAVIHDHPAVSECAVFGLPDERLGETLAAVVMVRPGTQLTADDVKAHVGAHLARFKVPEFVWLRDEQLPRIASGKIYKRGLRDEAIASLAG